ncbi:type VI secretion system protein TssA [Pirellulales bacterium]|nr:type VI secretion system protein TssA [Pirellulales bacterium]
MSLYVTHFAQINKSPIPASPCYAGGQYATGQTMARRGATFSVAPWFLAHAWGATYTNNGAVGTPVIRAPNLVIAIPECVMSVLDLESLLQPVSAEEPCGPDLQYDADFIALESASQGKPEQQYGDTIIPAEDPDWREMYRLTQDLMPRTKDLRVAAHMTRASLAVDGLPGFRDGLKLVHGYIKDFWHDVHPLLDVEDANDPTERVNIVSSLADRLSTVLQLTKATLVRSAVLGQFSMFDVLVARGEYPAPGEEETPDIAAIEGAFLDCDVDELRTTAEAAGEAFEEVIGLEATITDFVGAANAVSLEELTRALKMIRDYLLGQLKARGEGDGGDEPGEGEAQAAEVQGASQGGAPVVAGQIASREDVIRTLDRICEYYDRYEPSSPLPLLLKRAKRLVTKGFIDILEDLTPDGVSQARHLGGMNQGHADDE